MLPCPNDSVKDDLWWAACVGENAVGSKDARIGLRVVFATRCWPKNRDALGVCKVWSRFLPRFRSPALQDSRGQDQPACEPATRCPTLLHGVVQCASELFVPLHGLYE